MPTTCAVINCTNRGGRDNKRFFRLPVIITGQGEATKEKSEKRRRLWLAAIKRDNLPKTTTNNIRVCSDHFISGKAAGLYEETNPDWIPSLKLGYGGTGGPLEELKRRHDRLKARRLSLKTREAALSLLQLRAVNSPTSENQNIQTEMETAKMTIHKA